MCYVLIARRQYENEELGGIKMYRRGGMSTTLYLDQMRGFFITPTKRKRSQITICTKITQPKNLHAIARILLFFPELETVARPYVAQTRVAIPDRLNTVRARQTLELSQTPRILLLLERCYIRTRSVQVAHNTPSNNQVQRPQRSPHKADT